MSLIFFTEPAIALRELAASALVALLICVLRNDMSALAMDHDPYLLFIELYSSMMFLLRTISVVR